MTPPDTDPAATGTPGSATSSPSATRTPAATSSATAAPTSQTSPFPSDASPSPGEASPSPISGGEILLADDFSDPDSGWATGDTGEAAAAYADGVLRLDVRAAGRSTQSTHRLPASGIPHATVHIEATVTDLSGGASGLHGLTCGVGTGDHYTLALSRDGGSAIARVSATGVTILGSGRARGMKLDAGVPLRVAADCVSAGRTTQLMLSVDGRPLMGAEDDRPSTFSRVGVYAEALPGTRAFASAFDDVVVTARPAGPVGPIASPAPFPAELERALLRHVPAAIRRTCRRAPAPVAAALAHVSCIPGRGASTLDYVWYPNAATMEADYDRVVGSLGVTRERGHCARRWPAEGTYAVDGRVVGRLVCARSREGPLRIVWTDARLNITGDATRRDARRQRAFYEYWRTDAGPIE